MNKYTLHCSVMVKEWTVLFFQTIFWSEFIQYASKLSKVYNHLELGFCVSVLNPTLILFLGILLYNKQIIYLFVC